MLQESFKSILKQLKFAFKTEKRGEIKLKITKLQPQVKNDHGNRRDIKNSYAHFFEA